MKNLKLVEKGKLSALAEELRRAGEKIVFTNGCFDIIHSGHIQYLQQARSHGSILIIGVNSDASVGRIKPGRPVVEQDGRMEVLSALEMVDYVTLFDEDTPYETIKLIMPDVLVKGGDWKIDDIVGADIVKEVYSLPYIPGISTTGIIERITGSFC